MRIELRKVHYSKALSQETAAFTADIWVDGKKRGDVRNDGGGGANLIHPRELEGEIAAYAATLPPTSFYGMLSPQNAATVLGDALDTFLAARELRTKLRRQCVFTTTDGKLYSVKGTARPAYKDIAKVLNELPFDEALELYKTAGAEQ